MSLNLSDTSLAFAPSITGRPRSSLPSLSSVARPFTPVRLDSTERNTSGMRTGKKTKTTPRPRSAISTPSRDNTNNSSSFSTKQMAPFPPSCPKPAKPSVRRRHVVVPASYVQSRRSPELGSAHLLAVVGKPVGKADKVGAQTQWEEKLNQELVEEKEQDFKSKITKNFNKDKRDGSKVSPSKSFEELSKGSKIPVLSGKSSKSSTTTPSQSRCVSQAELPEDVIVHTRCSSDTTINDGPVFIDDVSNKDYKPVTVIIKKKCASETALDEKAEDLSVPGTRKSKLDRPRSARHVMDMRKIDMNAHYRRDLMASFEKSSKTLNRSNYRFDGKDAQSKLREFREILPSKPKPERMMVQYHDKPVRDHRHRKCGDLIDEIALNSVAKEFKTIHEMLLNMKRKYSVTRGNGGDIFISNFYSESSPTSCILVLKNLASEMFKMVTEVDNGIGCVQQSAQNIVTELQERFMKIKDNLTNNIQQKEIEVKRLEQVILELEYYIKAKDSNFASLEALVDNMNIENEKLEHQCREYEANKERLTSENEKAILELTFRVRELNNLRCDIQGRDNQSSQMADDYHELWKERNTLSLQLALLQSDLNVAENRRLNLYTENTELREQLDYINKNVLGEDFPNYMEVNTEDNTLVGGEADKQMASELCGTEQSLDDSPKHIGSSEDNEVQDKTETQPEKELPEEVKEEEKKGSNENLTVPNEDLYMIEVPQVVADRITNLELAIKERNDQLREFQEIITSLKERNTTQEKQKQEEANKYEVFRQETLEEAQHLRDIYSRLQEKETHLDELLAKNTSGNSAEDGAPAQQNASDDGIDWFEQCVLASRRLQELEDCMIRQDGLFKEVDAEKEALKDEVQKLKEFAKEHEKPEPVSFEGVQELLKDIQGVVNKLHKEDALTKKAPKAIRFYPDTDLAVKELQNMKKAKNTAVFIVANAFTSAKDFLYKKIGKKKGRKQRRKLKIKNLVDSSGNDRDIEHIVEEGYKGNVAESSNSLQEAQEEIGVESEEIGSTLELQEEGEPAVVVEAAKERDIASGAEESDGAVVSVPEEQSPDAETIALKDENAACVVPACDFLDLSQDQFMYDGFTESPLLSQSIKELKTVDVDSLKGVLQRGRSVNTLALKSSSVLLCYRQQLSPLNEFEESREDDKEEKQTEEEDKPSSQEKSE